MPLTLWSYYLRTQKGSEKRLMMMATTEPTTFNPPAPDLSTTQLNDSTLARICAHSAPQWETPAFTEIVRIEYRPSAPLHPSEYMHALDVIYFVRDVKVKELEEALCRHMEENALRYELFPSITLRPIYQKAITEVFENVDYVAAQLRAQCDPDNYGRRDPATPANNVQAMNASTAKLLGLLPELNPRLKAEKKTEPERKTQPAPELTCESLQRQWGLTIVRSASSGIKDARAGVLYDGDLLTIEKQHNRQPLRKLKGRKHDAD
jgi:hypothetical protein